MGLFRGIKGRLKQGLYPHKAPLGYLDTGRGQPKAIDVNRASFIQEMYELYATGQFSLNSLTDEMFERGFRSKSNRKIYRAKIDQLLANPFLIGQVLDHQTGQTYPGQHEAIISATLFNKVQNVRAGRHRKKKTKHSLMMRGLFQCRSCTNAMIGERQKGHFYYRCHTVDCPSNSVREEVVELACSEKLRQLKVSKDCSMAFADWSASWLTKMSTVPNADTKVIPISETNKAPDTLTEKLLAGVVDDATYAKSRQKLLLHKQELEEQHDNRGQKRDNARQFLELTQSLAGLYETAKPHEKRQLLELCFSNRTVHQKNVELSTSS